MTEQSETFTVELSNPGGSTLADPIGVGTIRADPAPSLRIGDATPVRLEFPILSLNRGLRSRCVSPDVWPTLSRA